MGAAQAIDLKSTIVSGSDLRILLGSDHVTYGDIYASLKEKGIFVGNSDKSITVPLLSATLLTPDNFTRLIESGVHRESLPKVKVAGLDLVAQKSDWITPLKEELFDDSFDILGSMSGVDFVTNPQIVVDGEKISIPYQVVRQDYSKDWIQRELSFDAQVTIERQDGALKLEFTSTHSSKETEQVNKKIAARIAKLLHGKSLVKEDEPFTVSFGALNNEERVRYFKRLTAGNAGCLLPGGVNDIEICLDPDAPALPDDPQISWMKQTVRKFNVDGERLNDIFLINDEKYYKHYYILRMDVTFPFKVAANEGECRVTFSFSGTRTVSPSSELFFEVVRWFYRDTPNADAKKIISSGVQDGLRSLIEQKFNQAISERPHPAPASATSMSTA
ncbi:GapS4b family protein [Paracidovorax oryzae]|uniref:GapS4b family protein n=1 Tax=Paracidovorax oryzae TaxID=862720 RepID=UPI0035D132CD